jgi:N-methylhydantoinase A/oxoprolinase/acetone carboxylase beta subunit
VDGSPGETLNDSGHITIGLGVDAGGTYTDAVLFDLRGNRTLCKAKSLTTRRDFTVGIGKALEQLDRTLLRSTGLVSLSTTLATNAIVENEGQKVGLLLMPPFGLDIDHNIPYRPKTVVRGQLDITGREIVPVQEDEIRSVARRMVEHHAVTAFAVSGFAGAINPDHELRVKRGIEEETGLFVTCGHELSDTLDFQTRAVTAVLNAKIIPRIAGLLLDLEEVLRRHGVDAPVFVVKGDGTLMSAEMAKRRPVETILSGPAASVAGARHLTGVDDALVMDMGGTTTDTAALVSGRVRLNAAGSNVGGRRTHVQALDLRTVGLGGDSLVLYERNRFTIGPGRVAPISWLGRHWPGTGAALDYLTLRLQRFGVSTGKMPILVATGDAGSLPLTPAEEEVLRLLEQRPRSIEEMLHINGAATEASLQLQRLEGRGVVQRCGLTLTDLLHIDGCYTEWDVETARRYAGFYASQCRRSVDEMAAHVLELGTRRLSLELLKRSLDDDTDSDAMEHCAVCRTLVRHLLEEQHPDYEVAVTLRHPVIGIGAPVRYFLPRAAVPLKARAVIPEHADVANAIGAITSHVHVRKGLRIVPGDDGDFIVEGVSGFHRFRNIDDADRFVRRTLAAIVQRKAGEAGTDGGSLTFETRDSRPLAATGEEVFLERTISASLEGRPDAGADRVGGGKAGRLPRPGESA